MFRVREAPPRNFLVSCDGREHQRGPNGKPDLKILAVAENQPTQAEHEGDHPAHAQHDVKQSPTHSETPRKVPMMHELLRRVHKGAFAAIIGLLLTAQAFAATLLPNGKQTFIDSNGRPLAGGAVYFYVPGTTTAKQTWQDSGQTVLNTNPVTLDSAGRAIIYGSGAYRQIVKDRLGNTIWDQVTADTSSSQMSWGGTAGGTANAITVTASNFTSGDGQIIYFLASATNTTATTLNPSGSGAINILKDTTSGPVSLTGGEIVSGNIVGVVYSSTAGAFHLVDYPIDIKQTSTSIASASTTNLGTITTRNALITGTTTITSFGSSASTDYPIYFLRFSGALQLTHNGTSLILPGSANITTANGDSAIAEYLGSGNWRVRDYQRINGKAVVETDPIPTQTGNSGKFLTTNGTATSWGGTGSIVRARASISSGTLATNVVDAGAVNIASSTYSAGTYTITFTNALASNQYQVFLQLTGAGGFTDTIANTVSRSTTGFTFFVARASTGGATTWTNFDLVVYGGY